MTCDVDPGTGRPSRQVGSSLATTGGRNRDLGCITCGDVGIAMCVVSVNADTALAVCRDPAGEPEEVDVGLVEPVEAGDAVLVHAGVALVRLTPEGAAS
jgi:hydrogenase maturation factor